MSYASVIAADNPTNWWRMKPGPSNHLVNEIASKPALAQLTTSPGWSSPQQWTGIAADGGSYLINPDDVYKGGVPCFVVPCISAPFSIELWTWTDLAVWNTTGNVLMFGGGANSTMCGLSFNGVGFPVWSVSGGGGCSSPPATTSALAVGAWVHQVIAIGAGGAGYYVNGAAYNSCTYTSSPPAAFDGAVLGSGQPTGVAFHACELATYSVKLSSAQVAAHYAAREVTARPKWRDSLPGVCT